MRGSSGRSVRWRGLAVGGVLVASLALVLAACTAPARETGGPSPQRDSSDTGSSAPTGEPAGHTGGVELPATDELPEADLTRHIVPLGDIHLDTFDGRSLPLSDEALPDFGRLRDAIPPIEQPVYVPADVLDLPADDLVLGYVTDGGQPYAYPIRILNFHEIVNDELDGTPLLVTYCPLCRSGVVFDRRIGDRELTFGNTSALYDNDMVMYDHQTNSFWGHVAGRALVGELSGDELTPLPSSMAAWAEWRDRHPDTLVLSMDTGFDRPYERDPFADYQQRVDDGLRPFPDAEASVYDDRLDDGEEILGIVLDGTARAYPLRILGDAVVNDEVAGTPLVVMSREQGPTGVAYDRRVDDRTLTFVADGDAIVDEETGSHWTLDGRAVDGPLAGQRLTPVPSRSSFWFAFVAAFPEVEVVAGDR